MVYVVSNDGKPLMPCKPAIARLLLKQGRAKCVKRIPFTVKLLYETTTYTQELNLKEGWQRKRNIKIRNSDE